MRGGLRASIAASTTSDLGWHRAVRLRRWHLAAAASTGIASAPRATRSELDYIEPELPRRVPARLSERVRRLHRPAAARPGTRRGAHAAARRGRAGDGRPRPQRQLPRAAPAAPGRARLLARSLDRAGRRRRRALREQTGASAMVGRTRDGEPLVGPHERIDRRRQALRRPERVHLSLRPRRPALPARRAHPAQQSAQRRPAARRARGLVSWADAHPGLRRRRARPRPGRIDAAFTALLRRGREYGPAVSPEQASAGQPAAQSPACTSSASAPTSRASSSSCRTPGR